MSDQHSVSSSSPPAPATLPEHLARWAAERPRSVALRHKAHGVWAAWTWGDLQAEVARVAAALSARRFERGDLVAVAADLSLPALAVTLAAQALGGAAIWIDPQAAGGPRGFGGADAAPGVPAARFGFARDEGTLADLHARLGLTGSWALGLFTAEHGATRHERADSAVRGYAGGLAQGTPARPAPLLASPDHSAFHFAGAGGVSQAAAIAAARAWIAAEKVTSWAQAFAWEGPTTSAAAIFLAGWLVAGMSLSLPEDATTADADRREVQPTVVAATGAAYARLWQQVADNLPASGTLLRALVDAGLGAGGGWVRRALGWWLVRRPLRGVLGFRRVAAAFLLGAAPAPAFTPAHQLLASLGVPLREVSTADGAAPALPVPASVSVPISAPEAARLFAPALAPGKLT